MSPLPSLLLALPPEVRFMIYRKLLLCTYGPIWPGRHRHRRRPPHPVHQQWDTKTAILGDSRQISDEALTVLYGENIFAVFGGYFRGIPELGPEFDFDFTPSNWLRVRRMSFYLVVTRLVPFFEVASLVPVLCVASLLERLTYLRIVVGDDRACYQSASCQTTMKGLENVLATLDFDPVLEPDLSKIVKGKPASRQLEKLGAVLDELYALYNKRRGFEVFAQTEVMAKYLNWQIPVITNMGEGGITQEGENAYDVEEYHSKGGLVLSKPRSFVERGPHSRGLETWRVWPQGLEGTEKNEAGSKRWEWDNGLGNLVYIPP